MRVRAAVARVLLGLTMVALAIASGDLSFGRGEQPRYRPNAVLIGRSMRDLRRPATARFAELLDTNPIVLYLTGVRVHVDRHDDGMNLIDRRGSAIDTLTWSDRRRHLVSSGRWTDQGPEFGLFFVDRG